MVTEREDVGFFEGPQSFRSSSFPAALLRFQGFSGYAECMLTWGVKFLFTLAMLCVHASVQAQDFEQQMEAEIEKLVAKSGKGTEKQLQQRLRSMARRDQAVRTAKRVSGSALEALAKEQEQVDIQLTAELKEIVAGKGWPTIRLVGLQASEDAALILTHSRDRGFQRAMIPQLEHLAEKGEILRSSVAAIVDKVLIAEGKPQRFGTQFKWANGTGEMFPVEDAAHLDERRAKYLLPPMAEYKRVLAEMYKLTVK
jgi:hypothetical protein